MFKGFQHVFKCAIQENAGMSSCIHPPVFLSAGTERKAEGNSESRLTFTKTFFQRHHDKTAQ